MAPNDPNQQSDVIDFKLNLIGEGAAAAMNSLLAQMESLQAHLQQFGGVSPEGQAAAMVNTSGRMQAGIQHRHASGRSTPPPVQPEQSGSGPSAKASIADPDSFAGQLQTARWTRNLDPSGEQASTQPRPPFSSPSMQDELEGHYGRPTRRSTPPPTREEQLSRMGFFRRLGEYRRDPTMSLSPLDVLRQETGVVEAREGYQYDKRQGGDYSNPSLGSGAARSGHNAGTSLPPPDPADPAWKRALMADRSRYERAQEGFEIPQFGEFTMQNKLNMGADWLTRSATNSWHSRLDRLTSQGITEQDAAAQLQGGSFGGVGGVRGYGANLLRMGADNAATGFVVHQAFRDAFARGRGLTASGTDLGYARGPSVNIPGTDIGFQLPGQGTMEGLRQRWTSTRLRMRSGISGDQAGEIVGSLASQGFSGQEGNNIALNYISDLVRQGQNPGEASSLFGQAVRNGNASMSEVAKTLNDLGDAARGARQTLSDYMEGLGQFSEQAQNQGALKGQGIALGRSATQALGISGQQAGEFLGSPIMQAMAMKNYGLLPNEIGTLGATAQGRAAFTNTTLDTIETAMRMAAGFNQDRTDAQGNVIVKGRDRQIAQAANFAGVSRETFEKMLRNKDQSRGLISAQAALETYRQTPGTQGHGQIGTRLTPGLSQPGDWIPAREGMPGAVKHDGIWMRKSTVTGTDGYYSPEQNDGQWGRVEDALMSAAPKGADRSGYLKQVAGFAHIGDPKERIAAAEGLISRAQKKASAAPAGEANTAYVKFTGKAAQYFEQDFKKLNDAQRAANAGGIPRNRSAAGYDPAMPAPPGFGG